MKNLPCPSPARAVLGALLLALPGLLFAQSVLQNRSIPSTRSGETPSVAQVMSAALTLRTHVAARVANGELTPAAAVDRLRQVDKPSGLDIDADAGLGLAVIDVAQRLLVQGKRVEAEALFAEAEKSLELAVKSIPDSSAKEKATLLRSLAHIQGRFLNKRAKAKENTDEALRLQPDDEKAKQARNEFAKAIGEHFKKQEQPRG